ncbi:uncharacterized protein LOC116202733 [Punica granatum]|uniref:DUF506 family protein n=2 Tax=Punica granatum TaxID=22663 RepID=A0A218XG88_PUNGR|nr:uncharacterized protein LOC116202733 [Punica granatum]OWM83352.1 hypothetical protein CDL15_Pgr012833 [Punica granatum]PKI66389.1 hypothetical protein CRG98_013191 [Punica granatum]
MAKIPIRFSRVAAAFDEVTRAVRLCQSSGSEHSAEDESPVNLSDLVASFMEREGAEAVYLEDDDTQHDPTLMSISEEGSENYNCSDAEIRDQLQNLFKESKNYGGEEIRSEIEATLEVINDRTSSHDTFKRRLMTILRERGFDAGLCKSRWEKTPQFPAGDYQYIDVKLLDGSRIIVEPFLAGIFQIARPTSEYSLLLGLFPRVFVGRPEELKQVVRLMCTAIKQTMKSTGLSVPPWRKNRYMQAKWFGSYKRTTNKVRSRESSGGGGVNRAVGFKSFPGISYKCREDFACKNLLRTGHLTAAFSGKETGL